jgi:hypothetical protein
MVSEVSHELHTDVSDSNNNNMRNNHNDIIILDSGASCHMFNSKELMTEYRNVKNNCFKVTGFNGTTESAIGVGNIGILTDVLHLPNIPTNILSTISLCNKGYKMFQSSDELNICNNKGEIIIRGSFNGKLWTIRHSDLLGLSNIGNVANLAVNSKNDPLSLLHYKYNHLSADRLRSLCKCNNFTGINNTDVRSFTHIKECEFCKLAKSTRSSFTKAVPRCEDVGHQWFVDVKGPFRTPSLINSNTYIFGLIDSTSRLVVQYFIQNKSEVYERFKQFNDDVLTLVRSVTNTNKVIWIHSDCGEFNSSKVREYAINAGIQCTTTCLYTPEQNGVIERSWRTIGEAATAMLLTAGLSETYWEEARRCAGFIYNRLPRKGNDINKSPFEVFFNKKPHINYFKVFGSIAYVHKPNKTKDHGAKAWKGVFVGYESSHQQGYRVFLPETNEIIVSAHVKFTTNSNERVDSLVEEPVPNTSEVSNNPGRKRKHGESLEDFKWLLKSRHIDDEDHLLYETTKIYTYKGDIVCDRKRVNTKGELESNGYEGPYHVKSIVTLTNDYSNRFATALTSSNSDDCSLTSNGNLLREAA